MVSKTGRRAGVVAGMSGVFVGLSVALTTALSHVELPMGAWVGLLALAIGLSCAAAGCLIYWAKHAPLLNPPGQG